MISLLRRRELGTERIAKGMRSNRVRANPPKTNFLWCAIYRRCIRLDTGGLSVWGVLIWPSAFLRDLGVLLESNLSTRSHDAWTVDRCFRQLCLIRSCSKALPLGNAKAAVAAFFNFEGELSTTACSLSLLPNYAYLTDS